jgi:hypothetical protein
VGDCPHASPADNGEMRPALVVLVYAGLLGLAVSYFVVLLPRHRRLLLGAIDAELLPAAWVHYTRFPPRFRDVPAGERGNVARLTMSLLRTRHDDPALESARRRFVRAYIAFGCALAVIIVACAAILVAA